LFGTLNNRPIEADGYGFGSGYRQHQWGNGGKGFGKHGFPNLAWALAWEGHAGLHFFTRFPKGVTNPFIYGLPEGFVVNRHWYGQGGDHWTTTHDVRFNDGVISKKVCMVGSGFAKGSCMLWKGDKTDGGNWIVRSWPQYAVAVPKGDDHIWYRSTFQFELNDGSFYTGYWEQDIHFRKKIEMPAPYVVKFWDETWHSDAFGWHFYEREEVEQSTYDGILDKKAPASMPQPKPAPAPVKKATPPPPKEPTPPAPEPEPVEEAPAAEPEVAAEAAAEVVVEEAPEPVAEPEPVQVAAAPAVEAAA